MKASQLALLAAAQLCCGGLVSETALAGSWSATWSNLWRTPDQQGQALLDAGKSAQAAVRFRDARRRAYADLEAGRYPQAAKLLAPFTDAGSEYNRGNALARSGQLQAALAAYDAALEQAPADKDSRHNRDLVERALRQQRQASQSSSGSRQQGGHAGASSGRRPQQSAGGQSGAAGSQQPGVRGSRSTGSGAAGHSDNSGQQEPEAPQASNQAFDSPEDSPDQARRDAAFAAALARAQRQRGETGNTSRTRRSQRNGLSQADRRRAGDAPNTGSRLAADTREETESKRQLALDRRLGQIPDNPAGLLRRKFLIEHAMKQQDGLQPQGGQ